MPKLDRRQFLTATGLLSTWPAWARAETGPSECLQGFVVADAHFGWDPEKQPPSPEIAAAMQDILTRFPRLDVFLDAGDAHHSYGDDAARREWTEIIANRCGAVPFHYVAGNHEVMHWGYDGDPEERCNRLGSVACRPYYSFDLKGIHFVSLPELMTVATVTREALDWLALDLEVNRDKTTLIFTHNALEGTTLPHDDKGYRRLGNTAEILALLDTFPHVVAWLHGHNHTWEICRQNGRFYVSCGRIGGFSPPYEGPFGDGHLGGIYFEIGPQHVAIRGYSATAHAFFDTLPGYAHLTQRIDGKTSFDPAAPPAYSYGMGGARDGQRLFAYHHHAAPGATQKVFVKGLEGTVISENPRFAHCNQRTLKSSHSKILPGFTIHPSLPDAFKADTSWEWQNPGLRLVPLPEGKRDRVIIAPGPRRGARAYYRCAPGHTYRARLRYTCAEPGQRLTLQGKVYDNRAQQCLAISGTEQTLDQGRGVCEQDFTIPALADQPSIYTDPKSDRLIQLMIEAQLPDQRGEILLEEFSLHTAGTEFATTDAWVTVDGQRHTFEGTLPPCGVLHAALESPAAPRSVVETGASGNGRVSWLVRQTGPLWQVRNAPVACREGLFEVGPLRNTFAGHAEIVIAPCFATPDPFLHRLRGVQRARFAPTPPPGKPWPIEIIEGTDTAEVVLAQANPRAVEGASSWDTAEGCCTIRCTGPGTLTITMG